MHPSVTDAALQRNGSAHIGDDGGIADALHADRPSENCFVTLGGAGSLVLDLRP